jgi:hypothetical protein
MGRFVILLMVLAAYLELSSGCVGAIDSPLQQAPLVPPTQVSPGPADPTNPPVDCDPTLADVGRPTLRHLKYSGSPPVAKLFLTMLSTLGVPGSSFGNSTGPMTDLS